MDSERVVERERDRGREGRRDDGGDGVIPKRVMKSLMFVRK